MELLLELIPAIGTIIAILIVFFAGKKGVALNKQATISTTMTVINKMLEIFNIEQKDENWVNIPGETKLNNAVDKAKLLLTPKELDIVKQLGKKAEKHPDKPTFGDTIKAGVQDIFVNSMTMLAKDKVGKLIKKL